MKRRRRVPSAVRFCEQWITDFEAGNVDAKFTAYVSENVPRQTVKISTRVDVVASLRQGREDTSPVFPTSMEYQHLDYRGVRKKRRTNAEMRLANAAPWLDAQIRQITSSRGQPQLT